MCVVWTKFEFSKFRISVVDSNPLKGVKGNENVGVSSFVGAVIEEHRSESNDNFLRDAKLKKMRDSQCHYLGRVHGHSGNSALSTCYGLVSQLTQLF